MCGTYLDVSAASELLPAAAVTRMQVNDRLQSARQQIDTLPCAVQRTAAHAKHASIDLNFSCRYILKKKDCQSYRPPFELYTVCTVVSERDGCN